MLLTGVNYHQHVKDSHKITMFIKTLPDFCTSPRLHLQQYLLKNNLLSGGDTVGEGGARGATDSLKIKEGGSDPLKVQQPQPLPTVYTWYTFTVAAV